MRRNINTTHSMRMGKIQPLIYDTIHREKSIPRRCKNKRVLPAPATGAVSKLEKCGIGLTMELNPEGLTVKLKSLSRTFVDVAALTKVSIVPIHGGSMRSTTTQRLVAQGQAFVTPSHKGRRDSKATHLHGSPTEP